MKIISSPDWKYVYALILFVSGLWIWLSKAQPGATTGGIPAPRSGFLAPDFILPTTTGDEIRLSELRGRAVLINFWASWCPPCLAEMSALENVFQEFQDQGFIILAINASDQDDRQKAIEFAQSQRLSFPILFDTNGEASQQYQVRALPSTYFVDTEGIIQEVVIGGPISEALLHIRAQQLIESDGGLQR